MPKVTVYSTPTCPWCHRTKEWLKAHKVAFTDINVAADRQKAEEMIEKSGQMGVPVTDIDGQMVIGFDEGKLKRLLKIAA
ncbi:glutaredoxin family protein [Candidatus Woesearchaeota archaeon]|nr:glutaredoxin family protein [Candidatus Woesearchaeota archaeon]